MSGKEYNAAIIVIGNEILSGRIQEANIQWIAEKLVVLGIKLAEVRIVPDIEDVISNTVNELRKKVDYVFTTGGIGPTHDDVTTSSIAKAFGVDLYLDEEAKKLLTDSYGEELTEAKLKMAYVPKGCSLIDNPVSGAPGFVMDNVYVMAGVPRIMQAMFDNITTKLKGGARVLSNTIGCALQESVIAKDLGKLNDEFDDVEVGSYPHYRGGVLGVSLVLRSTNNENLNKATVKLVDIIKNLGDEPRAIGVQSSINLDEKR